MNENSSSVLHSLEQKCVVILQTFTSYWWSVYPSLFEAVLSLLKIGRVFPLDPEHWEVGVYKEERVRAYPQGFTV